MTKRWLIISVAVALLIGGHIYGKTSQTMSQEEVFSLYHQLIPEAVSFDSINDMTARALDADGKLIAYVGIGSANGYGGPMYVGTIVEPSGTLREPVILKHNETPDWVKRITAASYFAQYKGKAVDDVLTLGEDIDRISGATFSCRAVADSVREASNSIARSAFGLTPQQPNIKWKFGIQEMVAILVFAAGFAVYRVDKLKKFRLVVLGVSIVTLGFWMNRVLSVALFSSLLLGYFPSPKVNLLFYILIIGAVGPILITGKNLYCTYICPFCGLQEGAYELIKKNISLGKTRKWLGRLRNLLLFAVLMGSMITLKATYISYEPFGIVFKLDFTADAYLWGILIASLLLGVFIRRVWCIGFCPAGGFLDVVRDLRNDIRKKLFPEKTKAKEIQNVKQENIGQVHCEGSDAGFLPIKELH